MQAHIGVSPTRPFPYVEGQTRRIKAEPTKLSGVALRVMAASGNFSTRRAASNSSPGLWLGAFAVALVAAAIAIVGSDARTSDRAEAAASAPAYSVMPVQVQAAARDTGADVKVPPASLPDNAAQPKAQEAAAKRDAALDALDAQDRYEVERFIRLTAAANEALAPAAGPATR